MKNTVKRIHFVLIIMMMMIGVLVGRMAQIQLIDTESFSKEKVNLIESSVKQRTQEMILNDGRGQFTDKNGVPLTVQKERRLVVFPFVKEMTWPKEKVASIMQHTSATLDEQINTLDKPAVIGETLTSEQAKEINALKIPGVFALNVQKKVKNPVAEQLIGITGENKNVMTKRYNKKVNDGELSINTPIGVSGLQSSFDEFLIPEQESKLLYHVDRRGGPLFGIEVKYTGAGNPFYPVSVQTTIDSSIQQKMENILDEHALKEGGAVLLDIDTNEVVAMTSRPHINQQRSSGVGNRMLVPQVPGSVFKTVIAAAAIDSGIDTYKRTFNCDLDIYNKLEKQAKRKGMLNFQDSFAESCNYTFGTVAKEMVKENKTIIDEYANKLGLVDPVGWQGDVFHFDDFKQFDNEGKGIIWHQDKASTYSKEIAQTAIGQRDVRVTPLAVANMMATIARGGEKKQVRVVDRIQYKNGATLYTFQPQKLQGDHIAPYTAIRLRQLLKEVVDHPKGTGRRFQSLAVQVAGKSGTADIRAVEGKNTNIINKWFAGYFPANHPKYALVVVDLNTESSTTPTNAVFYDIVNTLYPK
ncbi:peptidoglycan D,D-transpeptidase FtsI family protein [Priestia koreensis]|uniref:peptidoglycan D,D-transpeptidase FtsI family protein n=1 Tax=Priestia koreensis TaxID=284581 RepID=UPI003458A9FF